jgi:DNA modification methylase
MLSSALELTQAHAVYFKDMKLENVIYCGDNLQWMRKFPDSFVDLIYLDPPFFSNRHYEVIFKDGAEIRSFADRWKGGIHHYIEWMRERVFEMRRLLKATGSIYLHCDWHAGHYLKVMMDDVFGYKNFRNEIVWCYRGGGRPKKDFPRKHDTIFRYSKTDEYYFNPDPIRIPYEAEGKNRTDISMWGRHGDIDRDKQYGPHPLGKVPEDWWLIDQLNANDPRRLGYPTQKPPELLERIILSSSKEGDLVFDPFCGCGTTLIVAQKYRRRWLAIDVSPTACKLMKREVEKFGAKGVDIIGLPMSLEELKTLNPFEFQNWIIGAIGGTVSEKKVKDLGIDGYTFMERDPIQVKQQEKVGRKVVDEFETAIVRSQEGRLKAAKERGNHVSLKGIIVAFSFTKDAYEEIAKAKERGFEIKLLTVQDVVKEFQTS